MSARLSPDLNDEEIAMQIEQMTPEETAQLLAELLAGLDGAERVRAANGDGWVLV